MNALAPRTETELVPADVSPVDLQSALAGDLKRLTPEGRLKYYGALCNLTGLNPLSKPFDWLELQGKLILYANKGCAEQLRKIHGISLDIVERKIEHGCLIVRVKATDANGRHDESIGAVPWNDRDAANCMMKCETKAKRRVTLSICGLGLLDESELDTVRHEKSSAVVEALNGEESAASRASRLNAALTAGEKARAIPVEAVSTPHPALSPVEAERVTNLESPGGGESEGASRTGDQSTAAQVPATPPVSSPAPQSGAPAPSAPAAGSGLLDDETAFNLQTVLSEGNVPDGVAFLIAKKQLVRGAGLNTLPAVTAEWILKNSRQFHQRVEEWVKGGGA